MIYRKMMIHNLFIDSIISGLKIKLVYTWIRIYKSWRAAAAFFQFCYCTAYSNDLSFRWDIFLIEDLYYYYCNSFCMHIFWFFMIIFFCSNFYWDFCLDILSLCLRPDKLIINNTIHKFHFYNIFSSD